MALEIVKFNVLDTPSDAVQIDISTIDDSLSLNLVLDEEKALDLAESIIKLVKREPRYVFADGRPLLQSDLNEVVDLLKTNQKINAVKLLRERYNHGTWDAALKVATPGYLGLKEAKDMVDKIQEGIFHYGY